VNLRQNLLQMFANFVKFDHPKKKFTRFRQVFTVRQGFFARFSIVLTVFQKLVTINAISFLG
jgi:hypothetical protein